MIILIVTGQVSVDGVYVLRSYDDNYEKYLKARGVHWIVISLILGAKETVVFEEPRTSEAKWKMSVITGTMIG